MAFAAESFDVNGFDADAFSFDAVEAVAAGGGISHRRATRPRVLIMLDGVRHLVREEDLEAFLESIAEKAVAKAEDAPVVKKKAKRKRKAEAAPVMPRIELKTAPDDMYERIKERVAHINAKIEAIWFAALARKMEADDEEALLCLM
jgi:hypothetical protein